MASLTLYFATNRNHEGNRWTPDAYGSKFSKDGMENLRFGRVSVEASDKKIQQFLKKKMKNCGVGDGEGLSEYLADRAKSAKINAYKEIIDKDTPETLQKPKLGSKAAFADLQTAMKACSDVLVCIHGFNVDWHHAVGSALSLQTMLRNTGDKKIRM